MKIALINLISKTADRPARWWQLFGRTIREPLGTDSEVNFLKLADAIARRGHECHVYISDAYRPRQSIYQNDLLKIHYLRTILRFLFPPAYYPLVAGLAGELKNGRFDIIQSSDLMQPATIVAALTAKRIFVWQEQDRYSSRFWLRFLQRFYLVTLGRQLARRITFIPRSSAAKSFLEKSGCKNILDVIPTGVDTRKIFHPLNLDEEYLLVVSRLAADKGFDFLLDAMRMVVQEMPHVKLVVVGDGPDRRRVEKRIGELNLGRNVTIRAPVPQAELNVLYNRSLFTLIPTEGGLFPFVALESMAAGKPVISRFARALRDVIVNGKTGFIVDSPAEMAQRIIFLAENEPERKRMGAEALSLAGNFDIETVAGKFSNVFASKAQERAVGERS